MQEVSAWAPGFFCCKNTKLFENLIQKNNGFSETPTSASSASTKQFIISVPR
jgi:hypothetical protein